MQAFLLISGLELGFFGFGIIQHFKLRAKQKKIAEGIRLLISPASKEVWDRCAKEGILQILSDAGATVLASSCGACLGIHSGALGEGEVCISSTNRNFIGRMGSKKSSVYLASPLSVIASAIKGEITDPREFMKEESYE